MGNAHGRRTNGDLQLACAWIRVVSGLRESRSTIVIITTRYRTAAGTRRTLREKAPRRDELSAGDFTVFEKIILRNNYLGVPGKTACVTLRGFRVETIRVFYGFFSFLSFKTLISVVFERLLLNVYDNFDLFSSCIYLLYNASAAMATGVPFTFV